MIVWQGVGKLNAAISRAAKNFKRERDLFLMQQAELLTARAKKLTPRDTGRLANSWQRSNVEGDSIDVFNNTEYAIFVEYPHRQFVYGRDTGRITPGNFMLRDAVDEQEENFQADAKKILERVFK